MAKLLDGTRIYGTLNVNTAVIAGSTNVVPYIESTIAGANTAVGGGANTYLLRVIAGANTAVGGGANNYLLAVIAGANTAVGTGANNYQIAIQNGANTAVGGGANAYSAVIFAKANTSVQNNTTTLITVGYTVQPWNAGVNVAAYGTWTPNPANGNYQFANSNGAFTLAAPSTNCAIDVLFSNGTGGAANGAGAITFSGFKVQSGGTGDTYSSSTANAQYILSIRRINNISTYVWKALQ